jgi:hypothetical protein
MASQQCVEEWDITTLTHALLNTKYRHSLFVHAECSPVVESEWSIFDCLTRIQHYRNERLHSQDPVDEYLNLKMHKFIGQGTYTRANGSIYHSGLWVNGNPKK